MHGPTRIFWANLTPFSLQSSVALLSQLRAVADVTFVGGVPTHWREGKGDSKPGYAQVYAAMDVLSPWLVGRYRDDAGFDSNMKNVFVADAAQTKAEGIGYAPVVFPGFSWSNLMRTTGAGPIIFNQTPRRGGAFWTHQARSFAAMEDEPLFVYGAMFDEIDEGTAMLKAASTLEDTPAAPARFLYYSIDNETLPSDFYLSLAGNFTAVWANNNSVAAGCRSALRAVCSPNKEKARSPFASASCGVCAGQLQHQLRGAGCTAAEIRIYCESSAWHASAEWTEQERATSHELARSLTLQKLAARVG
jgi:hypothetical protein